MEVAFQEYIKKYLPPGRHGERWGRAADAGCGGDGRRPCVAPPPGARQGPPPPALQGRRADAATDCRGPAAAAGCKEERGGGYCRRGLASTGGRGGASRPPRAPSVRDWLHRAMVSAVACWVDQGPLSPARWNGRRVGWGKVVWPGAAVACGRGCGSGDRPFRISRMAERWWGWMDDRI
jgi:hypothetical protein